MAKYHNVPVVGFGMSDSCDFDQQSAYEKALKSYNYALAGLSWIIDLGGTAGFNLVSWPEMVLENEMAAYIGEYLKGIVIDEERLAVDTILKVGPLPGSYMKEKHTRQWFRKEFYIPELSNKEFFESWEREHVELQDKAKAKALDILDNHESPVDPAIQQELDDYLAHCMKRDLG